MLLLILFSSNPIVSTESEEHKTIDRRLFKQTPLTHPIPLSTKAISAVPVNED